MNVKKKTLIRNLESLLCALYIKRVTLQVKNMQLMRFLRSIILDFNAQ